MTIHKEGYKTIIIVFLFVTAVLLAFNHIFPLQTWLHWVLYASGLWFFIMIVRFFRSPIRTTNTGENVILCPADGKIVVIERTIEPEYLKDERIQVSIFMSATNVHVNWFPIGGEIVYYYYHPGLHMVAFNPKASLENERATTVIETSDKRKILVRQIAGAMARRIKCYPKVGEPVTQGEELGFIKFGSRVDLFLPVDTKLEISLNQKVTGKQTIIGRLA
ncbi:MAG: phosphatidylserine decarboxylase family protein [Bacteroidales bacterium]|jgi:phosphatidylserine decarboxylase|nr:phosphatidylserine decarboxylase family protein [Bacteroidales bacterium]